MLNINEKSGGIRPYLLSISDTCKATNLGRTSVYELINHKQLEAIKIGGRRLVTVASIEALIARMMGESA